jgi:predicted deacylase
MVKSDVATGGAFNYAGSCGIPSILIERGGEARWSQAEIQAYKQDVKNVLRHLGVMMGEVKKNDPDPIDVQDVFYETSPVTGCWYPGKKSGDHFTTGEILGVIKDYFGNTLKICTARYDGVILYQVSSLCIIEKGSMIAYGKLEH